MKDNVTAPVGPTLGEWGRPQRGQRWGQPLEKMDSWGSDSEQLLFPCRAVGQMMSTVFYPLVTFVLLLICIAYWVMTALYPLPMQPATLGVLGGDGKQSNTCPIQCLGVTGRGAPFSGQTQQHCA